MEVLSQKMKNDILQQQQQQKQQLNARYKTPKLFIFKISIKYGL